MDTSGLDAYLNELGDEIEAAVRPAAQAGTQVLYDAVKANVAALGQYSGRLNRSIYQKFSEEQSSEGVAVYNVSWNARKAPHGHLVEYGYLQRYVYGPDGMGPLVRPGMEGKPRPSSGGRNRVALDAYYITLPTPKHVPGKFFVRKAATAMDKAYEAAEAELIKRMNGKSQ
ncbi:HK97 gp10 family phage protein [Acidovorax sp. Root217]|uniref:HK97 gp10 family phage protein n=1 Tax=Acidovorax sp. Root217 TaxID=1736492 RepID=UPI001910B8FA|nr:HK97 gp10 family phage protein [Acidovorax sp. Root217]